MDRRLLILAPLVVAALVAAGYSGEDLEHELLSFPFASIDRWAFTTPLASP